MFDGLLIYSVGLVLWVCMIVLCNRCVLLCLLLVFVVVVLDVFYIVAFGYLLLVSPVKCAFDFCVTCYSDGCLVCFWYCYDNVCV